MRASFKHSGTSDDAIEAFMTNVKYGSSECSTAGFFRSCVGSGSRVQDLVGLFWMSLSSSLEVTVWKVSITGGGAPLDIVIKFISTGELSRSPQIFNTLDVKKCTKSLLSVRRLSVDGNFLPASDPSRLFTSLKASFGVASLSFCL